MDAHEKKQLVENVIHFEKIIKTRSTHFNFNNHVSKCFHFCQKTTSKICQKLSSYPVGISKQSQVTFDNFVSNK